MNKTVFLFIPILICFAGFFYNVVTGFEGMIIVNKFFRDGEDLHLGTVVIWGGMASFLPAFLILRAIKSPKPHFSKEIEDAFKEQQSKKTLPKGFEQPKNGDVK